MSDFKPFSQAVHKQFSEMSKHELFVVDVSGDDLFAAYLAAFPEGTNPIYRERTEHDCSCCKNFIRNIGNVVAVVNGKMQTVWDTVNVGSEYDIVAKALSIIVSAAPIKSLFRASEKQYGAESTVELKDGVTKRWNHFHGQIANKHYTKEVGSVVGEYNTSVSVFKRGLDELTPEAFATIIDLTNQNNLYKGNDFLAAVTAFSKAQQDYNKLSAQEKNNYIWQNAGNMALSRFRNTAIGTLLVDLSAGVDIEGAVKSFEQKVAPTNYKRPNALITQKMVDDAMKTIDSLGLEPALERRHATLEDVSVNDILFVDNNVRGKLKGGVANVLADAVAPVEVKESKAQEINVDDFLKNVVPGAKSIDVHVKNQHQANFVSITAPVHEEVEPLFKWDNNFAWSYDGNVTDSIKERVKAQGGITDAKFRVSLAWYNKDDLDLYIKEPDGYQIYFGNKGVRSKNTGMLDVDMNAYGPHSDTEPVENVVWSRPMDGQYIVTVNNYNQRTTVNPGFTLEVESDGIVHQYSTPTSPRSGNNKHALTITVKGGKVVDIKPTQGVVGGAFSQEKWNIETEKFVRVNTMMLSPNHWNGKEIGSKHVFFALEGCKNPVPTRGIYNEFLKGDLEKHRKVFELLGQKTMCQPSEKQISGLGFTSARGDSVVVKVNNQKLYNVKF
jgi:hypothetical protein